MPSGHFDYLQCLSQFYTIQTILWLLLKFKENVKQIHAYTEIRLGTLNKENSGRNSFSRDNGYCVTTRDGFYKYYFLFILATADILEKCTEISFKNLKNM